MVNQRLALPSSNSGKARTRGKPVKSCHRADHFGSGTRRAGPAERRQKNQETMKKRRTQSRRRRPGGNDVRSELGDCVTACALVDLYGEATHRAGGELAGAPVW